MSYIESRETRLHAETNNGKKNPKNLTDLRKEFGKDIDRILYSQSFRRLDSVTQILSPLWETASLHTRMTHSLKVGRVGRSIAQDLINKTTDDELEKGGGLDPDVVEAAGLAHDLGHPPFGHRGEYVLNKMVLKHGVEGGYEGNAQTFRILNVLEMRKGDISGHRGLDLCSATIAATVKYPSPQPSTSWKTKFAEAKKNKGEQVYPTKQPCYPVDQALYDRLRSSDFLASLDPDSASLEAQVMDLADDISYAVHDLEDALRFGWILPEQVIYALENDISIARSVLQRKDVDERLEGELKDELLASAREELVSVIRPNATSVNSGRDLFSATVSSTMFLSSLLIKEFLNDISVDQGNLVIKKSTMLKIHLLKQTTIRLLIATPQVSATQQGQAVVISELFDSVLDLMNEAPDAKALSGSLSRAYEIAVDQKTNGSIDFVRATADAISLLTEGEAVAYHGMLTGSSPQSTIQWF